MADRNIALTQQQAQGIADALEEAANVVLALEWITDQKPETTEMLGAFIAIKALYTRLDDAVADNYEVIHGALMNANVREVAHV